MVSYLVTGGAGFIGSHISEELVRQGHTVAILDNLSSGKMENMASFSHKVKFFQGDLCDRDLLRKALQGVHVVFHQAALPSVPRSIENPVASHQSNVNGTFYLLLAAREAGVRRVVYASSSSIYGNTAQLPKSEDFLPAPLSPYAANKLIGEYYCKVFSASLGLETVALRYFNVFGPRQDPHSAYAAVIPRFVNALLHQEPATIFGDGEQSRDFTYVDNVVQANLLAAEKPGIAGQVFNIACGQRITINSLYNMLAEIVGVSIAPRYLDTRPGDVRHSQADIQRARTALGYQPAVEVRQGLQQVVEWYRSQV